ncbi:MBL fold metallo-hydrolase [Chitinophaga sp. S165]|uniref:MBL fold metallo-hydrolase n=1 Tax=Chitinophaga sp. S165 TaxID=2135462 RepID=UPI000D710ADC|nr:MBL fold metallo-hydrolase [Chitinophaga sp. S165]PWV51537.1 L-ascorbate metabolism protein UlaG (beta-lactamase superfamily) [Chitinophaga sp. S165]
MKRWKKILRITLVCIVSVMLMTVVSAFVYMRQAQFGEPPAGERLARMRQSPNFVDGKFQNPVKTPTYAEGYSLTGELFKAFFTRHPHRYPVDDIPAMKTDLLHLLPDANVVVWFGHSSCFVQAEGTTFLIDPVFSRNASPFPGTITSFKGTDIYTAADMPAIDYLLISHDHYDHLDYRTVVAMKDKVKHVICGLGVGAHFERWGYPPEKIIEMDWHEKVTVDNGTVINAEPARHKSGRGFRQNNTLWTSYLIQTRVRKIYIGGDSGYGDHFAAIGRQYGPIDLAILENGQYDSAWHYVHCLPGEVLRAAHDLGSKRLFPVHSSRFALSRHPWNEPLAKISELNGTFNIPLVTPVIGEPVYLDNEKQPFRQWWKGVE